MIKMTAYSLAHQSATQFFAGCRTAQSYIESWTYTIVVVADIFRMIVRHSRLGMRLRVSFPKSRYLQIPPRRMLAEIQLQADRRSSIL